MSNKVKLINELRDKLHAFSDPSEDFIKAIKKECENHGIDPHIVSCSLTDFETINKKGNIHEFYEK